MAHPRNKRPRNKQYNYRLAHTYTYTYTDTHSRTPEHQMVLSTNGIVHGIRHLYGGLQRNWNYWPANRLLVLGLVFLWLLHSSGVRARVHPSTQITTARSRINFTLNARKRNFLNGRLSPEKVITSSFWWCSTLCEIDWHKRGAFARPVWAATSERVPQYWT